ncbi:MAG: tyrosine-type recombinase/integrase [Lachnospiraceae bacterium]|jgi:site-specific recombinase XerD|nr:tyrosine-type recombinase/integrase [Lachnospiraceae bacterium]
MANTKSYQEQFNTEKTLKLRELIKTLPSFVKDYFRAIEPTKSIRTRINYAYDIRVFFDFILSENPLFKNKKITDISLKDLEQLEPVDIEEYQEYLKVYNRVKNEENNTTITNEQITNGERGLARKMSALRSLYGYYYKHQMIDKNPTIQVDMPKIHDKAIIRLEADEIANLLDYVENLGNTLTGQAKKFYDKTKYRDMAILTLLLGTGIRVSECVGLDLSDVFFTNDSIKVTRKGGNEMILYFSSEVEDALLSYLEEERNIITPLEGHENALFLSSQRKRMSVSSIETMVKKYAKAVTGKKITPHKLRSTYGTALYKETGDIYLVADVLGHKDVNTTKKHYAAIDEDRRRSAANVVKLR